MMPSYGSLKSLYLETATACFLLRIKETEGKEGKGRKGKEGKLKTNEGKGRKLQTFISVLARKIVPNQHS